MLTFVDCIFAEKLFMFLSLSMDQNVRMCSKSNLYSVYPICPTLHEIIHVYFTNNSAPELF